MSSSASANHHHDFSFAPAVEFAEKDPLPTSEQQFPIGKRDGDGWPDEAGFDVSVGIFFAVVKAHAMLRDQGAQRMQHVTRHVRIGILIDRQPCRRVLHVKHHDTFLRARLSELTPNFVREFDQLLALM